MNRDESAPPVREDADRAPEPTPSAGEGEVRASLPLVPRGWLEGPVVLIA